MRVGIPKEVKKDEGRVSIVPKDVKILIEKGIDVYIESGAGTLAGYSDQDYIQEGAIICDDNASLYSVADLIVKVKEPQTSEYGLINSQHTVFSFFHFKGVPGLLEAMCSSRATCIAYETMQDDTGYMPVLSPMSKIAGEEAVMQGITYVTLPLNEIIVTIIGAGVVGRSAADTALDTGVQKVVLLDNNVERLHSLNVAGYNTAFASPPNIQRSLVLSHLIVGAVHSTGQKAPILVTKDMLDKIEHDNVFVDVSIDQGGMTEVSKIMSITDPTYIYNNTTMYCVPNMPGLVQKRASTELSSSIIEYVEQIASKGVRTACDENMVLSRGLAILDGVVSFENK
jgi:alanine dehydrogenase